MSDSIPRFAMTLVAPWAHLIVHADKRLENRSQADATRARKILGQRVALTCSQTTAKQARLALLGDAAPYVPEEWAVTERQLVADRGHLIGTARIVEILSPEEAVGMRYHRQGQWAIMLADVEALATPRPATGDLSIWQTVVCSCGRVYALGRECRTCNPPRRRRHEVA